MSNKTLPKPPRIVSENNAAAAILSKMNSDQSNTNNNVFDIANWNIPEVSVSISEKIKNNDNIILTIDLVEGVCSSHFYNSENNLLKVYSILNILMTILESTISNSEDICNSINGALKTMPPFDGFKEPK